MRLISHVLRTWPDDHQIPDLTLAELDYRLTQALDAIYSDPFLRERLYWKGWYGMARHLLGGPISEHEAETLAQIEHPIAWLMEGSPITSEAAAMRQDDIRLFAGA